VLRAAADCDETTAASHAPNALPVMVAHVRGLRTGELGCAIAACASPAQLAHDDGAAEDILARLARQQEQATAASRDGAGRAGAGDQLQRSETGACSVCAGLTRETTQCPRCQQGRPAVHKICEDEWLMRNKVCIFCRLAVRRKSAPSLPSGAGHLSGAGSHGALGRIFSYRSPRNKLLSAKLAALRREMSVGIQAAAALSDHFSKVSTDGDFRQIYWSTYFRDFVLLYIYIVFRVNVLEHLPQKMRARAAGGHARRDAVYSESIE